MDIPSKYEPGKLKPGGTSTGWIMDSSKALQMRESLIQLLSSA